MLLLICETLSEQPTIEIVGFPGMHYTAVVIPGGESRPPLSATRAAAPTTSDLSRIAFLFMVMNIIITRQFPGTAFYKLGGSMEVVMFGARFITRLKSRVFSGILYKK